jgi:hypothetical protein
MMDIKIDTSIVSKMAGRITEVEGQMPFLLAYALTKSVQAAQQAEREVMERVFDQPTRYTLNALAVIPATKYNLTATLHFREGGGTPAWKFLGPEVRGGSRHKKGFERALERAGILRANEYAVPSKFMPLDGNGNMRPGLITRILSDVGANPDPLSNASTKGRRKRRMRGGGFYFLLRRDGSSALGTKVYGRRAASGIYFRLGLRNIRPMLMFVSAPSYSKRLPYDETAQGVISNSFVANFNEGFRRYIVPKLKGA